MNFKGLSEGIARFYEYSKGSKVGLALGIVAALCSIFLWFNYIDTYAVNILFLDQWGFYNAMFYDFSWFKTFIQQHGPHRQGLGFVLNRFIDGFTHWNTRYIAFTIGILVTLSGLVHLRIKKALYGPLHAYDAIIFLLILIPVAGGIYANTPNISHGAMPVFLLALFCWILQLRNSYLRITLLCLVNFNMMFTGFGLFLCAITPLLLLIEGVRFYWSKRKGEMLFTIFGILLSLLTIAAFFYDYHFMPAVDNFQFPYRPLRNYLYFVIYAFSNAVGLTGIGEARFLLGSIIVISVLIVLFINLRWVIRNMRSASDGDMIKRLVILILTGFSLLFLANSAVGRVSLGLEASQASRYVVYITPALLGVYFHFQLHNSLFHKALTVISSVILIGLFVHSSIIQRPQFQRFTDIKTAWRDAYLQYEDVSKANDVSGVEVHPRPKEAKLQKKLDYLKENKLNLYAPKD